MEVKTFLFPTSFNEFGKTQISKLSKLIYLVGKQLILHSSLLKALGFYKREKRMVEGFLPSEICCISMQ